MYDMALTSDTISEIQVTYTNPIPEGERIQIQSSSDACNTLRKLWNTDTIEYREEFYVLYLSRSNTILGYFLHSIGGVSGTVVDTRQILAIALKANASGIILSHSHPSGNLKTSQADINITKKIVEAAKLFDISVLDHLILTKSSYYSFADEGVMPTTSRNNSTTYM